MMAGLPDRATDVLIIDDDWLFVEWACEAFRKRGFVVRGAPRADGGPEAFGRDRPPKLILLDHALPGSGSRDFLEMVRGQVGWAETPVVLLTGPAPAEVATGMRIEGFVRKPLELPQLMSLAYRYAGWPLGSRA
ncbi:MAG TPA: response regulator [Anaeromyxobacteraceae bacterium]|nr:response regulator [Anaeromyxobacteraceae bacterium]